MSNENRYIRQEALPQVGKPGQALLAQSRVAIVGLGALGSVSAEVLARSGVGYLRLIDNDCVQLSNLQRVALYDEADVKAATPKVSAAARTLAAINSTVTIETHEVFVDSSNIMGLLEDVDLILDGSDNFDARYLINEAANKLAVPWIYTGVLGTLGMVMPILPSGPCLCCLSPEQPPREGSATIATAGILSSTTRIAATMQATHALKMLLAGPCEPDESDTPVSTATLLHYDVWESELERIIVEKNPLCPVCSQHQYKLLDA